MNEPEPYWYLASHPKSGNTWYRVMITVLRRLAGLDTEETAAAAEAEERQLRLNRDLANGSIVSSRPWLDDQLGIDSADLRWSELDEVGAGLGTNGRCMPNPCDSTRCTKLSQARIRPAGRPGPGPRSSRDGSWRRGGALLPRRGRALCGTGLK